MARLHYETYFKILSPRFRNLQCLMHRGKQTIRFDYREQGRDETPKTSQELAFCLAIHNLW